MRPVQATRADLARKLRQQLSTGHLDRKDRVPDALRELAATPGAVARLADAVASHLEWKSSRYAPTAESSGPAYHETLKRHRATLAYRRAARDLEKLEAPDAALSAATQALETLRSTSGWATETVGEHAETLLRARLVADVLAVLCWLAGRGLAPKMPADLAAPWRPWLRAVVTDTATLAGYKVPRLDPPLEDRKGHKLLRVTAARELVRRERNLTELQRRMSGKVEIIVAYADDSPAVGLVADAAGGVAGVMVFAGPGDEPPAALIKAALLGWTRARVGDDATISIGEASLAEAGLTILR